MATTIQESFRQFSSNLNITDKQAEAVSTCRNNVVTKIKEKLSLYATQPSKLIGSYDRDTLIRYLSEGDVDVMVVLHYGDNKDWDNEDGVNKVLAKFKSIITEAYPTTECGIDRNCLTMKLSKFRLDVVPAFISDTGNYYIPDTYRKKWLETNPVEFSKEVTRINKNMDSDFIPLVKMVKGWNRGFNKKLRGFHIECMMIKHYKDYTQSYTFDSMIKVFFYNLPSYLNSPSYDPITGDRVDLYLDNSSLGDGRETFVNRAKKASEKAESAFNKKDTDAESSINEWKDLLGDFFPIYG